MKPKTPILLMSAVLLLAALSSSPAFALSNEVQADLLNQQIVAALDAKNWQQAEQLFTDYAALEVTMPTPLIQQRAIVSYHLKKFSKALLYIGDYLDKADRNSPSYKKALTMYAAAKAAKTAAAKIRLAELFAAARGGMSEFLCNSATRAELLCVEEFINQPGCYAMFYYYHLPSSSPSWSGPCVNGLAHGNGIVSHKDSYEETGSYETGLQQGKWLTKSPDGDYTNEIPYVDGKRHGKEFAKNVDGATRETPYVDGKRHGKEFEKWASGNTRETPWVDGIRHGKEFVKWADGRESVTCYYRGSSVNC